MTLEEYSKELGLYEPLSLESLILSHKNLREVNKENAKLRTEGWTDAHTRGRAAGFAAVVDGEYIAITKLLGLTVLELAQFLSNHADLKLD